VEFDKELERSVQKYSLHVTVAEKSPKFDQSAAYCGCFPRGEGGIAMTY